MNPKPFKFLGLSLLLISCLSAFSLAESGSEEMAKIRPIMHLFYSNLLGLKPYLISQKSFQNPANKIEISHYLSKFAEEANKDAPQKIHEAKGFVVTYDLLSQHLKDTQKFFDSGATELAWNKLNATTSFCIACHSRLPVTSQPLFSWTRTNLPIEKATLQDAEFYFVGRQFDKAEEVYDYKIRKYSGMGDHADLTEAFQRKIAYFARIKRDPKAAIVSLKEDQKNANLPFEIKNDIKIWIESFHKWADEKSDPSTYTDQQLVTFATPLVQDNTGGRTISVADPYVVNLMRASGLLYERLFTKSNSASTPELLYLLAKCERALIPLKIYSLADIYLKQCVLEYPKHPIAKKCFEEYELYMKGRLGVAKSQPVLESIESLRRRLD